MEQFTENNEVRLCGAMAGPPAFSHRSREQDFFRMPLQVLRLSGASDTLPLLLRREQLEALEPRDANRLWVSGELRSFHNRREAGAKLVVSVFVRELGFTDEADGNLVRLRGVLCREPTLRATPLGREISDLLLAVERRYGRTDYLPCICWGALARRISRLPAGQRLRLEGRLQSRDYQKLTEAGLLQRTAYEVSAMEIDVE
jgi:hypothetical protein